MNLKTITHAISSAEKYPYILKAGVFGSFARGDEGADSDVDIIFEYDDSNDEFLDNIDDFMEDIEQHITCKIDYVTLNSLMRGEPCDFAKEVLREVKWIYIK